MAAVPTTAQQNELPFPADKYIPASRKWLGKLLIIDPSIMKVAEGNIAGKDIIDIGCGDGNFAQELAQMGANKVIGIDSNHEMILTCKSKFNNHKNVDYREESSLDLSEEAQYDLAFSIFALQFSNNVNELRTSLTNIGRSLKPGGEFIAFVPNGVGDLNPSKANGIKFGASIVLNTIPPIDGERLKVEFYDEQANVIGESTITFFYRSTYERCLKDAGFTDIEWIDPIISEEGLNKYGEEFFSSFFHPPKDLIVRARIPQK